MAWVVFTTDLWANRVEKSSTSVNSSTEDSLLAALRAVVRHLCHRASWAREWLSTAYKLDGTACVRPSGRCRQPGTECQSPMPILHLHRIGMQMVAEDLKSEFIVARKSIFHNNSRQGFKRLFCDPIYFFTHVYIAIHPGQYLGAEWFHEATLIWNWVFTK